MNAAQAAEKAGVSPSTVTRWIQAGRLAAKRLPNGQLEIPADGLEAVIADRTAAPRSAASLALAVAEERIRALRTWSHSNGSGWGSPRAACNSLSKRSRHRPRLGHGGSTGAEMPGLRGFPRGVRSWSRTWG